jgi:hypothetical protein
MLSNERSTALVGCARSSRAATTAIALVLAGLALGGCSIPLSDLSLGGGDPAKEKDSDGYLAVNATPTGRDEKVLEPSERAKVESELIAARERQAAAAAATAAAGTATAAASPAAAATAR